MSAKHAIKSNIKKALCVKINIALKLFKILKKFSYNPCKLNVMCLKLKHLIEKLSHSIPVRIIEN
jgi:hypothetical protein